MPFCCHRPFFFSAAARAAARCWALLLARIFECLPLLRPRCGEPIRIIVFVLEPPVIERILTHIGEPTEAPEVWLAREPLQTSGDASKLTCFIARGRIRASLSAKRRDYAVEMPIPWAEGGKLEKRRKSKPPITQEVNDV